MKRFILIIAVTVVLVSVLGVYFLYEYFNASNIEGPSSGYLTYYYNNEETKIFLIYTDNPRYDFYNWSDKWADGEIREGAPCFIVTVTVRNDYTTDPLWTDEDSPSGLYNNYVKLTAILYDQQGRIDAVVTYPINSFHGGHVFRIEPEEAHSVELYLQTESKYVEWYEIYIAYVGPAMEP